MIERILYLIDSSGLSDSAMCKELDLGNGIIGKWRKEYKNRLLMQL